MKATLLSTIAFMLAVGFQPLAVSSDPIIKGEKSWWSNLGVNHFQENDGHWIDVLPPPRKRELKLLPYLIGGVRETKTEDREPPVRVEADVRYEVTPQLRLVGAANPDFENIEQTVEGIDFSYGERYVADRRPFFSEGGNIFGDYFHSRRIVDMTGGLKLFGKIGKNTSIGTLGTYHPKKRNWAKSVLMDFSTHPYVTAKSVSSYSEE